MADRLRAGEQVPDFDGFTLGGRAVNYRRDGWQKKFVVLVTFREPASEAARTYRSALARRERELTAHDTLLLVRDAPPTEDQGPGTIPSPSVVIVDRWGEARDVQVAAGDGRLPAIDAIVEWLRFVQVECPECQGEAK